MLAALVERRCARVDCDTVDGLSDDAMIRVFFFCRRVLQPVHRQGQPAGAGGGRLFAQQRPLQPARLGRVGAVRVPQARGRQVAVHLRGGRLRPHPRPGRLCTNLQMPAAALRPAAGPHRRARSLQLDPREVMTSSRVHAPSRLICISCRALFLPGLSPGGSRPHRLPFVDHDPTDYPPWWVTTPPITSGWVTTPLITPWWGRDPSHLKGARWTRFRPNVEPYFGSVESSPSFFTEFFCHRSVPSLLQKTRFRRDPRQLEEEEEMWFNSEDDDVEENGVGDLTTPASVVAAAAAAAAAASSSSSSSSSSSAATSPTATSPLGSTSLSFSFFFEKMWTF